LLVIPLIYLEPHIFHFTHYSLPETLSVNCIILSIFFLWRSIYKENYKTTFISALFLAIACFLKVLFIYSFFIFPLFYLLWVSYLKISKQEANPQLRKIIFRHIFFSSILLVSGFIIWYFPNKSLISKTLNFGIESRFIKTSELNLFGISIDYLLNIKNFLTDSPYLKITTYVALISIPFGVKILFKKKTSMFFKINFLIAMSWFIIELHKFGMNYLPTRYLIGFYFSSCLLLSLTIYENLQCLKIDFRKIKSSNLIIIIVILFTSLNHIFLIYGSYQNKTYDIIETNNYFKKHSFSTRPIMGSWASSLARNSKAITNPIFEDRTNHKKIINNYNPRVIIFEEENKNVFIKDGIIFDEISDSVIVKKIGNYNVNIAWLK